MKMMWGLMVILSHNQWTPLQEEVTFDDGFWNYLLEKSVENGINTILLDVGDGVQYESHPEIALKNAWSRERVRAEVRKCRELGIELIPKLNFSSGHSYWLGEYRRMTSSSIYYKVCSDLINEIYDMFEKPEYIHIGMDEEFFRDFRKEDMAIVRKCNLFMHDLKFLIDEVKKTGAKAWLWADSLLEHTDEFVKLIDTENVLLSPWYYDAFKRKHYQVLREVVGEDDIYYKQGFRYVETIPNRVMFRKKAASLMKYGYHFAPTASVWSGNDYNTMELMEYFEKAKQWDGQVAGYLTAPWVNTLPENKAAFDKSFRHLKEAREHFFDSAKEAEGEY